MHILQQLFRNTYFKIHKHPCTNILLRALFEQKKVKLLKIHTFLDRNLEATKEITIFYIANCNFINVQQFVLNKTKLIFKSLNSSLISF